MADNKVIVTQINNEVVVSSPGLQGPSGRTILNGSSAPSNNLGVAGDFYYNTTTTDFYGPKPSNSTWSGATVIRLVQEGSDYSYTTSWELAQVVGPTDGYYSVTLNHNMGFYPNVTVKTSAGDILETGIDYNTINQIKLTMAQPFAGTAYLS